MRRDFLGTSMCCRLSPKKKKKKKRKKSMTRTYRKKIGEKMSRASRISETISKDLMFM